MLKHLPSIFFMVILVGILFLTWEIFAPFAAMIILSAIFVSVFYPLYKRVKKLVRNSSLASSLMCLLITLVIILPVAGIVTLLAKQSIDTYVFFETKVLQGEFNQYFTWLANHIPIESISDYFRNFALKDNLELIQKAAAIAQDVSSWLIEQGGNLVSSASSIVVSFLLMLFTMFYFFKDGPDFLGRIIHLSPLASRHENALISKFQQVSNSVIFGTFATAIAQGIIGGIGFWIVGIDPIVWGVAMAFFSLVPVVGTAIIWLPAAIILLVTGNIWEGIFLVIWGVAVIGMTDNILRPFLMKGKMELHPLIIFFAILGGIAGFGFLGIIFGPLIIAMAAAVLHIYELEYSTILDAEDRK